MIGRSKISMKHVAAEAGVSVGTVSAVLGKRTTSIPISKKTRQKVREAAKKLNYYVNDQARALRQGHSNTILVAANDITQPFSGMVLRVVANAVQHAGYHFLVSDIQISLPVDDLYLGLFSQRRIDGILFSGISSTSLHNQTILGLAEKGVPLVLTEREIPEQNIPCVVIDNVKGGLLATEHLIRQGCRSVAYIAGPSDSIISTQREQGYRQALEAHGLEYSRDLIVQGDYQLEAGYSAMRELLKRIKPPAGVFTFNDNIAFGAMRAIREAGLSVPGDIAMVGYDDIPMAEYTEPSLTTVRQPVEQMYTEGVQMLLEILDGKEPNEQCKKVVLEPTLAIRHSSVMLSRAVCNPST